MASNSGAPAAAGASGPGVVVAVRRELNDADMGPAGRSRDRYATTHDLNVAQLTDADVGRPFLVRGCFISNLPGPAIGGMQLLMFPAGAMLLHM